MWGMLAHYAMLLHRCHEMHFLLIYDAIKIMYHKRIDHQLGITGTCTWIEPLQFGSRMVPTGQFALSLEAIMGSETVMKCVIPKFGPRLGPATCAHGDRHKNTNITVQKA